MKNAFVLTNLKNFGEHLSDTQQTARSPIGLLDYSLGQISKLKLPHFEICNQECRL